MSGGGLILETGLFTRRRTEKKCDQCDLNKEVPLGEIEYETEMECPGDKKTGVKLIYQGQEKKVIIVSTIRSSLEYVSMDSQYKLGFLFSSKRFNLGMRTENVRIM